MHQIINEIRESFDNDLKIVTSAEQLENLRIAYLGRKGKISQLFEDFKNLPNEEKRTVGKELNILKTTSQNKFDEMKEKLSEGSSNGNADIDLTLPGRKVEVGTKHILTQTLEEMRDIFRGLGFSVHEGPELESDHLNFEMLNFPADHPARDMQDTFFVNKDFLLRTHTSPVQIRLMSNQKPPLRAIMPGKVYRNEAISAKSYCLFHQVEGLYIDTDVTFAELKGTIVSFAQQFYGKDVKYRFRPSFFPFTEPSAEVDIWWEPANGKEGRWLEILGCGMVDPNVLENCGIDSEKYVGYAFGMGVERIAMLKYGVSDIRTFFDNDKRFLKQF
ncbi:MAG: phenylalanine--tRNA ligase subunit alpha [Melioribacteraceae bacterium]|nr:phenylalanine--tRNA ligase subunit alpha [Melioribacteraceae bacterium]